MNEKWNRRSAGSVIEEINKVAEEICTGYCKYAAFLDPDNDEDERLMNRKCQECPLNRPGV